jgi:hypothetical protein
MSPTLVKISSQALGHLKSNDTEMDKSIKARFCARGDRQQEGIDYFETWALVVQWSMVGIVMTLVVKMNLISVQCDITAAFIHGRVPVTKIIYVHQPRGFH